MRPSFERCTARRGRRVSELSGRARKGEGRRTTHAGRTFLAEMMNLVQLLVELSFSREFEHQENSLLVVKVAVQPQDVRVPGNSKSNISQHRLSTLVVARNSPQMTLNLNFPPQLFLNFSCDQLLLVKTLEGDNILWLGFRSRHVDSPKLSFAQRTTDFEVRESERMSLVRSSVGDGGVQFMPKWR